MMIPVSSLSLPGRSGNSKVRKSDAELRKDALTELHEAVKNTLLKRSEHSQFAKLDIADLVWANDDLTFVGSGVNSNEAGFTFLLRENAFTSRTVAHVRNIFDVAKERPFLTSVFVLGSSDCAVLHKSIIDPRKRRLVNEYSRLDNGEYVLVRHDVDFIQYLHSLGFRVLPVDDKDFDKFSEDAGHIPIQQSTNHVLMVAPYAFAKNSSAAEDNFFMQDDKNAADVQKKVLEEFSQLHWAICQAGIQVHLFTHEDYHDTPDAVFPNNWFSTHTDLECGECTIVLYPMKVPNRRKERRPEFLLRLEGFQRYQHVIDLTRQERASIPRFLEGTGSLVLNRIDRVAYVALSERSDLSLAQKWARLMQYELITFTATDSHGRPIYHTNVMMAIGTTVAVVCLECIEDVNERKRVIDTLESTNHEIVEITREQVNKFCGNVLELEHGRGYPVMAMSTQAYNAFTPEQRSILLKHEHELIHADISTIETVGGGGVRCAIAELF